MGVLRPLLIFSRTMSAPSGSKPIQLYSLATPNGQKIGIALEEFGVEYDAHLIDISKNVQFEDWYKQINPNSKIPAIVDRQGPGGKEICVFESGAILIYLADKYGKYLSPVNTPERYTTLEWIMWQMGGVGPMFGQLNHFYNAAPEDIPYAKQRYLNEGKRLLEVLDKQLSSNKFISGQEYTIADMCTWPWVNAFFKGHKDKLGDKSFPNVEKWIETIGSRPQVQKGIKVCARQ
ncbi:unnamed protein product [Didymodactylos carnosus]|uniref:Glutathione S-transferase n=1 Tax=Didymodactylos carnosus TaxID=1234261 RepID=A0A813U2F3_9BILA|nr:unnamed protein product [Didymodactylos carnosus]CAF1101234.1 unnamed protein product [Didymodactylos carnosus]CAF3602874.1 unnamed protein product [Didymodactylos carnosus]CAF3862562.1 unnamed protein product [Didymodactylos carnosus]